MDKSRSKRETAKLVVQALIGVWLVVGLATHMASVGLIGLSVIVLATSMSGIIEEHALGKAFEEALPFTSLLVVFFAVARVVIAQNPDHGVSPLDRNGFLMTHFGPMDRKAVYGQILVVPAAIAFFGVAVSVIIALTGNAA